jgi:hypothetical protein
MKGLRWSVVLPAACGACAALADIHDIRGPVEMETLPPFVLTGGVLVLGGALLLVRRQARRPRREVTPPRAVRSPADLLASLADDFRRGACPGDLLIVHLDRLVRDALAARIGLPARRLTSLELRLRLAAADGVDVPGRARLDPFLALCDRVKFAGHLPSATEIDAALRMAADLLGALPEGRAA